MDLSKISFDDFWKICQTNLTAGLTIPNWSVSGEIKVKEFRVNEVYDSEISFISPTAKNIQIAAKRDFENIFAVWEEYKSGNLPRYRIRDISNKSTYVIAAIRFIETYK